MSWDGAAKLVDSAIGLFNRKIFKYHDINLMKEQYKTIYEPIAELLLPFMMDHNKTIDYKSDLFRECLSKIEIILTNNKYLAGINLQKKFYRITHYIDAVERGTVKRQRKCQGVIKGRLNGFFHSIINPYEKQRITLGLTPTSFSDMSDLDPIKSETFNILAILISITLVLFLVLILVSNILNIIKFIMAF